MFPKSHLVFLATLLLTTTQLSAQMITDGTLGRATNLTGPNFQIPANLGQQLGGNLFHSFKEFNINTGQSATFTAGPDSVQNIQNILTRVTGGQRSWIDGPLRSEIPNANFYLLNPSGILFGKNARLDISGVFYASTADGVNLEGGGKFLAREPNQSVLTSASPVAFGFLDSPPASIDIQGETLTIKNHTYYAPNGQINLTANRDIHLEDSTLYAHNGQINVTANSNIHLEDSTLYAPSGQIKLKAEKITLWESSMVNRIKNILNNIDHANIDVSGSTAGQVFIQAGQLVLNGGIIFADVNSTSEAVKTETSPKADHLGIDIQVTDRLELNNGALITADNNGEGQGNNITIKAGSVKLNGQNKEVYKYYRNEESEKDAFRDSLNRIATNNFGTGTGGTIQITTSTLEATEGYLEASTAGSGKAGNLFINANDSVTLDHYASISSAAAPQEATGEAGTISLATRNLTLRRNGYINGFSKGTGPAGSITIATETTVIDGTGDDSLYDVKTGIYTEADNAGGGNINLQVHNRLEVINSKITAKAWGTRLQDNGGNITIQGNLGKVNSFSLINSQLLANANRGHGGSIDLYADKFTLSNSEIDVSSRGGFNGSLFINSFRLQETIFPQRQPLGGERLFSSRCAPFSKENLSRFIITARDILPRSPEDWRTHSLRLPR
jgi:filamentous hemagglutinin family protein